MYDMQHPQGREGCGVSCISIVGWEKFQHYKDRDPPWVKLYRDLLTTESWVLGTDQSRLLQLASILLAARYGNKIPYRWDLIRKVATLDMSEPQFKAAVQHLVEHKFLEYQQLTTEEQPVAQSASSALATCTSEAEQRQSRVETEQRQNPSASATPARKAVSRGTPPEDPEWLLDFKLAYPPRAGDQGWRKAVRAAHARIAEGHTSAEFVAGARRYAAFCEASGKLGTEYVKQACTFLGPDKPFLLPWHAPPRQENATERILRALNGTDHSRTIEHEPEREFPALTR